MHCLGLMSGTSADGVDAVLVRFDGPPQHPQWCMLRHHHQPYPLELQQRVVAAGQGAPMPASCWLELAEAITEVQAKAVQACEERSARDMEQALQAASDEHVRALEALRMQVRSQSTSEVYVESSRLRPHCSCASKCACSMP